ncbi:unnamed protein product, partial [Ectocarpus sp. 8 AP-2014]
PHISPERQAPPVQQSGRSATSFIVQRAEGMTFVRTYFCTCSALYCAPKTENKKIPKSKTQTKHTQYESIYVIVPRDSCISCIYVCPLANQAVIVGSRNRELVCPHYDLLFSF